jgi:hypothetical protein
MAANTYKNQSLDFLQTLRPNRGMAFGVIIITALLAFEIFNYGTTDYALTDLLGNLTFMGLRWATILAIAFCGIDFAGIARLFAPELGSNAHNETWYLFGAWILAATMNAMLTWWGVSLAILNNQAAGNAVIERETMLRIAPIFVAVLVWLIRVLIIGAFSVAGDKLFTQTEAQARPARQAAGQSAVQPSRPAASSPTNSAGRPSTQRPLPASVAAPRPASSAAPRTASGRAIQAAPRASYQPPEPEPLPEPEYTQLDLTYEPLGRTPTRSPVPTLVAGEARNPQNNSPRRLS